MYRILVVYASDYGSTEKSAQILADGASSIDGVETVVKKADDVTVDDVVASDALVVGSPVHMGSPDWRIKKFIDTVCSKLWMEDKAIGKIGAVFTSGSGFGNTGGGAELCQLALLSNLAELGMILVPLPKNTPGYANGGLQWGPHARAHHEDLSPGALTEERLDAMRQHGINIAKVARAHAGKNPFAD